MIDPKFFCRFCKQALVRDADYQGSRYYYYKCTVCKTIIPSSFSRHSICVIKPEDDVVYSEDIFAPDSAFGLCFDYTKNEMHLLTIYMRDKQVVEELKKIHWFELTDKQKNNITEQQIKLWLTFS